MPSPLLFSCPPPHIDEMKTKWYQRGKGWSKRPFSFLFVRSLEFGPFVLTKGGPSQFSPNFVVVLWWVNTKKRISFSPFSQRIKNRNSPAPMVRNKSECWGPQPSETFIKKQKVDRNLTCDDKCSPEFNNRVEIDLFSSKKLKLSNPGSN